jgi:hypothetical protein
VTPQFVDTTDDFDQLGLDERNCKFSYESDGLKVLNKYSRIGCEVECALNKSAVLCQCMPWYYPNNYYNVPICDMLGGYCFEHIMSNTKHYRQCRNVCLDDCKGIHFVKTVMFKQIDFENICRPGSPLNEFFKKSAKKHFSFEHYTTLASGEHEKLDSLESTLTKDNMTNGELCKNFVEKYIAMVTVETPTNVVVKSFKDQRASFVEKIGLVGGTIGLFTGLSFLSLLDWAIIIYRFFMPEEENNQQNNETTMVQFPKMNVVK